MSGGHSNSTKIKSFLTVLPTDDRGGAKGEYIVCINPENKDSLGLGRNAVAVYEHTGPDRKLLVPCRIVTDADVHMASARMDQTLRTSLGIVKGEIGKAKIELFRLHIPCWYRLKRWFANRLGFRYVMCRVSKADPEDMEKQICRIPATTSRLLGTGDGAFMVCEAIRETHGIFGLVARRIRAYEVNENAIDERKKRERDQPERYLSPERILGVKPDLPMIIVDKEMRHQLFVKPLDALRTRRDLWNVVGKQIIEAGLLFFIAALAASVIIPLQRSWLLFVWITAACLIITFIITAVWARAKMKTRIRVRRHTRTFEKDEGCE